MPKSPRSNRPHTAGRPEEYFARGFEFYLDGRHGTFSGQVQAAAYLFHLAVELMLKSVLLTPAYEHAMKCIEAAREAVVAGLGPDVVRQDPDRIQIDSGVADACLEPYRKREEQLKGEFVHRLDPLWREFKNLLGKPELDRFDPLITKISQWEGFRYPVFVRSRGNVITFSPFKGQRGHSKSRDLVNRYDVNREEVDELIEALLVAASYSPHWIRLRAGRGPGLGSYRLDNRHVLPGV